MKNNRKREKDTTYTMRMKSEAKKKGKIAVKRSRFISLAEYFTHCLFNLIEKNGNV